MNIYRSVIIDDDLFTREQLHDKVKKNFPELNIVAVCNDATSGMQAIELHKPHLVFLDIEMPDFSGFEMLNKIDKIFFEIIFVTAFNQYAIKAIRFSALDYLLKPINTDELRNAILRFYNKKEVSENRKPLVQNFMHNLRAVHPNDYKLAISSTEGTIFLSTDEIIRLEAEVNYTKFFLRKDKNLMASKTLKEYSEFLSEHNFIRIHKSHLVNRRYIKSLTNDHHLILDDNSRVEVSRRKWDQVKSLLRQSA